MSHDDELRRRLAAAEQRCGELTRMLDVRALQTRADLREAHRLGWHDAQVAAGVAGLYVPPWSPPSNEGGLPPPTPNLFGATRRSG